MSMIVRQGPKADIAFVILNLVRRRWMLVILSNYKALKLADVRRLSRASLLQVPNASISQLFLA